MGSTVYNVMFLIENRKVRKVRKVREEGAKNDIDPSWRPLSVLGALGGLNRAGTIRRIYVGLIAGDLVFHAPAKSAGQRNVFTVEKEIYKKVIPQTALSRFYVTMIV